MLAFSIRFSEILSFSWFVPCLTKCCPLKVPRYGEGNFLGPTIMCNVTTTMDCYKVLFQEYLLSTTIYGKKVRHYENFIDVINSQCCDSLYCGLAGKYDEPSSSMHAGFTYPFVNSSFSYAVNL